MRFDPADMDTTASPTTLRGPLDRLADTIAGMQAMHAWCAEHLTDKTLGYYGGPTVFVAALDAPAFADLTRRLMAGAPLGDVSKDSFGEYMSVVRQFGGDAKLTVSVERGEVCEYVVTGTETVEAPDPDAPTVTITRDIGEWKCSPILADGEVAA